MNLELDGLDELIKEIDKLENVTEELRDEALIKGGEVLEQEMKDEVYRNGLTRRSGDAKDSITKTEPVDGELYVGTQGGAAQPGFYLYMHEFGYFNVRAQRFIAPRPFASIAYENSISKIMDAYAEVFRKGLGL